MRDCILTFTLVIHTRFLDLTQTYFVSCITAYLHEFQFVTTRSICAYFVFKLINLSEILRTRDCFHLATIYLPSLGREVGPIMNMLLNKKNVVPFKQYFLKAMWYRPTSEEYCAANAHFSLSIILRNSV